MRTLLLATLFVAGPASAGTVGNLTLDLDGMPIPGTSLTFNVTEASPGQTVYVAVSTSTADNAACPAPLGGRCLDIVAPTLVASGVADASGAFSQTITVPNSPPNTVLFFQSASRGARRGVEVSPISTSYNPRAGVVDANAMITAFHRIDTTTTPWTSGSGDFTYDIRRGDGFDVCVLRSTQVIGTAVESPPIPCPECEFAFDFQSSAFQDLSVNGDCDILAGSLTPFLEATALRVGFDSDASFEGGLYGTQAFYYAPPYASTPGSWFPLGEANATPGVFTSLYFSWGFSGVFYY